MQIVRNSRADRNAAYKDEQLAVVSLQQAQKAAHFMRGCPLHAETPLHSFDLLATRLGVGQVFVKDETARLGLSSFKALGGAYAVMLRSPNSPLRDSPAVESSGSCSDIRHCNRWESWDFGRGRRVALG